MEVLKAFILGVIQGVTEFLPVSSSGHMSVFRHFSGMDAESSGLFAAMLHIGTLVAIILFFYKPIYELFAEFISCFSDIRKRKFSLNFNKMSETRRMLFMFIISCLPLLVLLIPVGDGKNLLDAVKVFGSDKSILAEGICFMVTGFLVLLGSTLSPTFKKPKKVTSFSALLIGIAQTFAACFPGISRSGSTISTGLCCGISKNNMVRYSFILSIPAVLVSGLIEFKDAMSADVIIPVFPLIVGVITSALVGLFAIKLLEIILKRNRFKYFGYYCTVLGLVVTVIGIIEKFKG